MMSLSRRQFLIGSAGLAASPVTASATGMVWCSRSAAPSPAAPIFTFVDHHNFRYPEAAWRASDPASFNHLRGEMPRRALEKR